MKPDPDGLPTLQEELDRKVLEAVELIHQRLQKREINQAQAFEGTLALFTATAGLVDREIMDIVTMLRAPLKPKFTHRIVLFNEKAGALAVFEMDVGAESYSLRHTLLPDGTWKCSKTFEHETAAETHHAFRQHLEKSEAVGWRKV